jgi:hypothetical protein
MSATEKDSAPIDALFYPGREACADCKRSAGVSLDLPLSVQAGDHACGVDGKPYGDGYLHASQHTPGVRGLS